MLTTEQAWAVGILEGEGCAFLVRRLNHPTWRVGLGVNVKMTDRDVVERAAKALGGGAKVNLRHTPDDIRRGHATTWEVAWRGVQAERVMRLWLLLAGERRAAKIRECLATPNLSHYPRKKAA